MKNLGRWFLAPLLLSISFAAFAADDDFLEFDRAFAFSARTLDAQTIEVRWKIAMAYYMYRDRISFAADHAVALAAPQMPAGKVQIRRRLQEGTGDLPARVDRAHAGARWHR